MDVVWPLIVLFAYTTVTAPLSPPRIPRADESAACWRISIYFGIATAARIPRMTIMMISSIRVKPFELPIVRYRRATFISFVTIQFVRNVPKVVLIYA